MEKADAINLEIYLILIIISFKVYLCYHECINGRMKLIDDMKEVFF